MDNNTAQNQDKNTELLGVSVTGLSPNKAESIVLLHSSLSNGRQWRSLVAQLNKSYHVINIDLLGYGNAAKVSDIDNYSLEAETNRINEIVNHCIGRQKFYFIGHSCGGAIALKLAVEQSQNLLGLGVYEPVAFHLLPQGSCEREEILSFSTEVAQSDNEQATRVFTGYWNNPDFFDQLPEKLQRSMVKDIDKVNLDFRGLIGERYSLVDCQTISCPVLIIKGNQSPKPSQLIANLLNEHISHSTIETVDASHMAPITHAEQVNDLFLSFLNK